jgi:hypothetical protein
LNVRDLRGWLLQLPKPASVRVTIDGEVEELPLGKSYAKLADTIWALKPEQVRCLDPEGRVLRAPTLEPEDTAAKPRAAELPQLPLVIQQDPQAALLHHFASLLHTAYEFSTGKAFDKLSDLMERMNERSDSIEQRLERAEARARRLQEDQLEDALDRAQLENAVAAAGQGEEAIGSSLLQAFLSGQMQRKSNGSGHAAAPNGANGNGAPKGKA